MSDSYTVQTESYGKDESQKGELYLTTSEPKATVCLLHGGFWKIPYGREQLMGAAARLCDNGHNVWNIGYRQSVERFFGRKLARGNDPYKMYAIYKTPEEIRQAVIHGTDDEDVPIELTRDYLKKAEGMQVELIEVANGTHMDFLNINSSMFKCVIGII